MKPISERNLSELADLMYESGLEIWHESFSSRLREIHEETRWVSVSERLPEYGDHVLVYGICCNELYDDDTEMSVDAVSWGSVDHSHCTGTCYYGVWYKDITHWKRIDKPGGV